MNDGMDVYLGRCLKNWAAYHQPPADGRRRLLQTACLMPVQQERWLLNLLGMLKDRYFCAARNFDTYCEWSREPVMPPRVLYFNVAVNWRLAS